MIPDRLIEKVHLGEATEAERARVLADPAARARLEALPALDAAFLAAHPADPMVRQIEDRARIASAKDDVARRRAAIGGAILMPLVAVGLALVMIGTRPEMIPGTGPEPTTAKGPLTAKLRIYRVREKGPERMVPGTVLRERDQLQVGIVPGNAKSAVVVSIDGRGGVTLHFPPDAAGSTELLQGQETLAPNGYELDDAPEYERFFLVADDEPVPVDTVLAAAEALVKQGDPKTQTLSLPPGLGQSAFLVRKEPR